VEENGAVAGSQLVVGRLSGGTVALASQRSAARTTVAVMAAVGSALPADGAVLVEFPAGFVLGDGGATEAVNASVVLFGTEAATPARVLAVDAVARSVLVGVGGDADAVLGAFDQVPAIRENSGNEGRGQIA
jgi:hypothetical protein